MSFDTLEALEARLREAAQSGRDPKDRVDAMLEAMQSLRELERWDRLLELAGEAEALAGRIGYAAGAARAKALRAFVRYIRSDYQAALAECYEALDEGAGDALVQGGGRLVLASVHWSLGNFDVALREADRSIGASRTCGDAVLEGFGLATRGGILHGLGEYGEALASFRQSHTVFSAIGYPAGLARSCSGMGSAWQALGEIDKALDCHQRSLEAARSIGHGIGISRALNDIGEANEALGKEDEALGCHIAALEIRRREGYRQAEATSLLNLGRLHARRGQREQALEALRSGLAIAEEIGARPKTSQFHLALSEVLEAAGDAAGALFHFKAHEQVKSELAGDRSALRYRSLELEARLESAQKDAEIHRLRNVELAELVERLQAAQAELVSSERMATLGRLVAALAHEINSPLGVIRGSADVARRCAEKLEAIVDGRGAGAVEALRENAQLIADAGRRIHTLVERFKNFAALDRAAYGRFDLAEAIDDALALLEPEMAGRIQVARDFGELPPIYGYPGELSQVFMNLLRNAVEAIDGRGAIRVRAEAADGEIRVAVSDTGRGIPAAQIPALFEPAFARSGGRVHASLGLFSSRNTVRSLGGEIRVESAAGAGSTFTVVLPRRLEQADPALEAAARPAG